MIRHSFNAVRTMNQCMDSSPQTLRLPPKNKTYSQQSHQSHQPIFQSTRQRTFAPRKGCTAPTVLRGAAWFHPRRTRSDALVAGHRSRQHMYPPGDIFGGRRQQRGRQYGIPPPTSVSVIRFGGMPSTHNMGRYMFLLSLLYVWM